MTKKKKSTISNFLYDPRIRYEIRRLELRGLIRLIK
jgi:hypothetical protein